MNNSKVIGYGIGSLGKDLALGVIGSYLLIFYTDILGISAAAAGAILVLTKIWDAINDPIMGTIVDKTNTKWGRFRPYVLFVPIPLAVFSALCFVAPDFSTTGKVIYALVTYTITGMLFTAYDVPLWGMVPSITNNQNESNKCISSARFFTSVGMLIATTFAYPMIQKLGGGAETENLRAGYPKFMAILGVASVIFAWITFACTKEREHVNEAKSSQNVFKSFLEVIKNRNVSAIFITMILQAIAMILPNTIGAFYVINYLGRPELVAVYFAVTGIIGLLTAPVTSIILKKIPAKKLTIIAMSISIILSIAAFFIPAQNITLIFIVFALFGFFMPVPMVSVTSLLVDAGNEIYSATGKRADGVLFSLNSFAIKCGTALASGIASIVLTITHYNASEFVQAPEVAVGINITRTLIVAVVYAIAIVVISRFSPSDNKNN